MMNVWQMSVTMIKRLVPVPVGVRFSGWIGQQVLMLMMCIVAMRVLVFQGFMQMIVLVCSVKCIHTPKSINKSAGQKSNGGTSCSKNKENVTPINGAAEK